ncbi:hypothetical protein DAETH_26120 [Deinococcus aetherius]|uniref:Carbohydrate binding module xylan-binding domain-containing protein n=1 Tax=Deinococcus aetherius TaxID=200252 RepID=A0ABN6RH25_9DEIO|nr:Ig-like domain-containing protein [Deinococcus aetherius]BDP42643.1 hypothetical protein DAETH_26120 [Deinococcus aetherius]
MEKRRPAHSTITFPLVLLLSVGLMGCSQQSAVTPTLAPDTLHLEAEEGTISPLAPQEIADPRSGGRIIRDPNAQGGKAVILLGTNDNVRFKVPGNVKAGRYTVSVQGRGENFQGWPIVDLNDANQKRLAVATLDSATYVTRPFGDFDLKPGQVFNLSFINDLYEVQGKDRNAIVDYLLIEPAQSTLPSPLPPPAVNQPPVISLRPLNNGDLPNSGTYYTSGVNYYEDDHNITLEADASDPDGKVARVEFFWEGQKIGEDTTAPYTFIYGRNFEPDTAYPYSFSARAVDDQGAVTSTPERALTALFGRRETRTIFPLLPYQAINFGGPASGVNRYNRDLFYNRIFYSAGDAGGFTTNGTPTMLSAETPLVPSNAATAVVPYIIDPEREALIRSAVSRRGGLEVKVPVPNSTYDVYLWVRAEDTTPYDIQMEGQSVSRFDPKEAARWDKLGPFVVTVTDGVLNVASTGTATANFSAIQLWRRPQVGDGAPTVSFDPGTPREGVAGQPLSLSVEASSGENHIERVEFFAKNPYSSASRVFKIGEAISAPFNIVWQYPPQGDYSVSAVAFDSQGQIGSSGRSIYFR